MIYAHVRLTQFVAKMFLEVPANFFLAVYHNYNDCTIFSIKIQACGYDCWHFRSFKLTITPRARLQWQFSSRAFIESNPPISPFFTFALILIWSRSCYNTLYHDLSITRLEKICVRVSEKARSGKFRHHIETKWFFLTPHRNRCFISDVVSEKNC